MNKVTTSILIVFLLIIGWIFYLTNIKQDSSLTVRYYSISELASEPNDIQKVKVGGYIKPNSIEVSENDQLEVSFFVYQNDDSVKVYYYGIRPDLFKDAWVDIVDCVDEVFVFVFILSFTIITLEIILSPTTAGALPPPPS